MELYEDERLDYLVGDKGMQIIQSPTAFSFSLDAVLLAHFARIPIKKGNILDLCSGNGVIPLLLSRRTAARITGVEIQERIVDMGKRSIEWNGLTEQINLIHGDLKEMLPVLGHSSFDVVTCNPPYFPTPARTEHNINPYLTIARHEVHCTLEEVIQACKLHVRPGGKVAMVHRPSRLVDILTLFRKYRIEPKRLRLVYPKKAKEANILLIEGIRDGKADLKILPPLYIYDEKGNYTEEAEEIIFGYEHMVYILKCKDQTLYTGYTNNLEERLKMHEAGKGAKYTRGRGPFQLMHVEKFKTKQEALKREYAIKQLSRKQKLALMKRKG